MQAGRHHQPNEPTVGLQLTDVAVLARALDTIVDAGHSVLVVEHDPVLRATCDWPSELGPAPHPTAAISSCGAPPEEPARSTAAPSTSGAAPLKPGIWWEPG